MASSRACAGSAKGSHPRRDVRRSAARGAPRSGPPSFSPPSPQSRLRPAPGARERTRATPWEHRPRATISCKAVGVAAVFDEVNVQGNASRMMKIQARSSMSAARWQLHLHIVASSADPHPLPHRKHGFAKQLETHRVSPAGALSLVHGSSGQLPRRAKRFQHKTESTMEFHETLTTRANTRHER